MATQLIDMDDVTSVHFNNYVNDEVQEVKLNGTTIWAKPQGEPMYIEMIWNAPLISPKTFYLQTKNNVKHWNGTIEYSADTVNWYTWDPTVSGQETATSSASGHLYLRGSNNSHLCTSSTNSNIGAWWFPYMADGEVEIIGKIETLLDYQTVKQGNHVVVDNYCFAGLFAGNAYIKNTPDLLDHLTNIPEGLYREMFSRCTKLTDIPSELPGTIIRNYGYQRMFYGCTSLTKGTSLKATQLYSNACGYMFADCTNLEQIPDFKYCSNFATNSCYAMFQNCSKVKISISSTGEYINDYKLGNPPTSYAGTPFRYMFQNTGGTTTDLPYPGIYYTSNTVL